MKAKKKEIQKRRGLESKENGTKKKKEGALNGEGHKQGPVKMRMHRAHLHRTHSSTN